MENKQLLYDLYKVFSPSRGEKKMRKFIKDYIKRNIPEVELSYDNTGNIYAKKGKSDTFPCVVSHIDQVQKEHGKDFMVIEVEGKAFGFSPKAMEMRGLGADDKNGIWVCLQVLAKYDVMKCAFFVGEEIGCVGSDAANMDFFDDCRFVLQCDRRNGGDLITSIWGDLCSEEFLNDTDYKSFGYKECEGLTTDVGTLKDNGLKVSCVNMSCGYYAPHTDEEWTKLDELQNCLEFVEHIVEKCVKVYPHEMTKYGRYGHYGKVWDDWDDYYYGGGHRSFGPDNNIEFGRSSGKVWGWNPLTHSYEWIDKEEEVNYNAITEAELDDIAWEIGNCLDEGMEDEDIITDIQLYYPAYSSTDIQRLIDAARSTYGFRHFS